MVFTPLINNSNTGASVLLMELMCLAPTASQTHKTHTRMWPTWQKQPGATCSHSTCEIEKWVPLATSLITYKLSVGVMMCVDNNATDAKKWFLQGLFWWHDPVLVPDLIKLLVLSAVSISCRQMIRVYSLRMFLYARSLCLTPKTYYLKRVIYPKTW